MSTPTPGAGSVDSHSQMSTVPPPAHTSSNPPVGQVVGDGGTQPPQAHTSSTPQPNSQLFTTPNNYSNSASDQSQSIFPKTSILQRIDQTASVGSAASSSSSGTATSASTSNVACSSDSTPSKASVTDASSSAKISTSDVICYDVKSTQDNKIVLKRRNSVPTPDKPSTSSASAPRASSQSDVIDITDEQVVPSTSTASNAQNSSQGSPSPKSTPDATKTSDASQSTSSSNSHSGSANPPGTLVIAPVASSSQTATNDNTSKSESQIVTAISAEAAKFNESITKCKRKFNSLRKRMMQRRAWRSNPASCQPLCPAPPPPTGPTPSNAAAAVPVPVSSFGTTPSSGGGGASASLMSLGLPPPPAHVQRALQAAHITLSPPTVSLSMASGFAPPAPPPSSASAAMDPDPTARPPERTHTMFVGRVLVGCYTTGTPSLRKPPPLDPSDPMGKSYDSCVDNVHNPKIYVVFDSSQCYPEYLIEYTNSHGGSFM